MNIKCDATADMFADCEPAPDTKKPPLADDGFNDETIQLETIGQIFLQTQQVDSLTTNPILDKIGRSNQLYIVDQGVTRHGEDISNHIVIVARDLNQKATNLLFIDHKLKPCQWASDDKEGFYGGNLANSKDVYLTLELVAFNKLAECGLPVILIPPYRKDPILEKSEGLIKSHIRRLQDRFDNIYMLVMRQEIATYRDELEGLPAKLIPLKESINTYDTIEETKQILSDGVQTLKANDKTGLIITSFSDIKAEKITWLWDQWLPLGKLTLLAGAGGCGKTTLLLSIISATTVGGKLPDGTTCTDKGSAIIWSSEDDPTDTLKPRLVAAGADVSKVYVIQGRTNDKGEHEPFDAATDMPKLVQFAKRIKDLKLLMIDPIVNVVSGDMHRANDVRRSLQVIVDFAAEQRCAVVGITHFAKGTGGTSPAERVIGSQSFSALARMVWTAAQREDERDCILVRAKTNISEIEGGFRYQIEQCTIDGDIDATRAAWLGAIDGTARELLSDIESTDNGGSALDDAREFLTDLLSPVESMPSKEVKSQVKDAGLSWRTVERASTDLRVKKFKPDGQLCWHWKLPDIAKNDVPKVLDESKQKY